jgi:hypothetical protein
VGFKSTTPTPTMCNPKKSGENVLVGLHGNEIKIKITEVTQGGIAK